MTKYLENYSYQFYPCGYLPLRYDTNLLWVRYKTKAERDEADPFIIAGATESGAFIDAPDRELYFDRAAHVSDSARPLRNWDEAISLSYMYELGNDYPNDRFMINHTSMTSTERRLNWRDNVLPSIQTNKTIICDSGGFQLSSGKEVWIDPEHLTDFYNVYVDEGVTLDIPIRTYNRELLVRMLAVQKKNSKMIMEGLKPGVRLANVAHGFDYQDFTFVRERLWENERMDILCIPSSRVLPDIKSIDRLLYHMTHGMEYRQYHLLGIYNMTWLSLAIKFIYEWNKTKGKDVLLTSDASSAIYSASALRYHKQPMPYRSVSRWPIGLMAPISGPYNMASKILPCQCAVCAAIKYQDVFNILGDINISAALTRHNENETIYWTRLMCEAAATMDTKTYLKFCLAQNQSKDKKSITDAFLYMEHFFDAGANEEAWRKTHAKFKHKISTLFNQKMDKDQLFESSRDVMLENEDVSSLNKHLDVVLKRYEKFHRTGKKPKMVEKNRQSFFSLLGANSTGVESKK